MDKNDKERLINDIEDRLDDFFGKDQNIPTGQAENKSTTPASNPLEQLKSVVLSIDWEITDGCLADLEQSVNSLMTSYQDDKYTYTMLRMLNSLGKYIKKRKAQAHPDAIKRVMSVFKSLEQIVGNANLPEKQKKSIVAAEIRNFKELKNNVEIKRLVQQGIDTKQDTSHSADRSVSEIEKSIETAIAPLKAELDGLKQQIKSIMEELDKMKKS